MKNDTPLNNTAPISTPVATKTYENNPFFVAANGLELLFKKAQSVGIALAVLAGLSLLMSLPSYFVPPTASEPTVSNSATPTVSTPSPDVESFPVELILIIGLAVLILLLIIFFVSIVVRGAVDYTSAQLAQGKTATLKEALGGVFQNFWGYTWVIIVANVKTFLWFLLLVIPGFIMSYRYSLSGVAFFEKQLRGNAAVKHSAALTKGAWLTTYASQTLLNMITLGAIPQLLMPGTNAVLYRQFSSIGDKKPKAHVLSWLTLIVPFILLVLVILLIMSVVSLLVNSQP